MIVAEFPRAAEISENLRYLLVIECGLCVVFWGLMLLPVLVLISDVTLSELGSRLDGVNIGLYVILRLGMVPFSLSDEAETEKNTLKYRTHIILN